MFLKNSGQLSLRIYIFLTHGHDQAVHTTYFEQIIQLLNAHSGRWRHLEVHLPYALASQLTGAFENSHSQLEDLRLLGYFGNIIDDDMHPTVSKPFWGMKSGRPSPLRVEISGESLRCVEMDWNNITEVTFTSLYTHECLELFRQVPRTISCTLFDIIGGYEDDFPESECPVPTLSSLKKLKTSFSLEISEPHVMNRICAPALTHLSVTGNGKYDYVERLIDRSKCQLSTLNLGTEDYGVVDGLNISSLAHKTQRLKSLSIYSLLYNDLRTLLEHLAKTSEPLPYAESDLAPGCFPRLSMLECAAIEDGSSLPWSIIPTIFPPSDVAVDIRYRPFRALGITVYIGRDETSAYIDPKTVHQLLGLVSRGVWLRIYNWATGEDFIEASCKYHGIEIPEGLNFIDREIPIPVFD